MQRKSSWPRHFWLAVFFLAILTGEESMARSSEGIDTGLASDLGRHCWYDDTHAIVLRRVNTPDRTDQTVGLYMLDVTKPREARQLDLAPIPPEAQRELVRLSCQDQIVVVSWSLPDRQIRETYTLIPGQAPERLAELRGAEVSLRGHYILGNSARVISDGGAFQGTFEGHDDCNVRYVRPGFRILCWDALQPVNRPLTDWVLSEYRWRESIKIRGEDGRPTHISNPAKPLLGSDGKPLLYGLHLRDLNGKIVANLNEDPRYGLWVNHGMPIIRNEMYVYASCNERAVPIGLAHIVCRYRLDGQQHAWEEVFRFELVKQLKASITKISVINSGDVYFVMGGIGAPKGGIWWFDSKSQKIEQVIADTLFHMHSNPSVSPNGKWLLYVRSGKDGAKLMLLSIGTT